MSAIRSIWGIETLSPTPMVIVGMTKNGRVIIDCPQGFLNNRTEAHALLQQHWLSVEDFWSDGYAIVEKGKENNLSLDKTSIRIIWAVREDFSSQVWHILASAKRTLH